MSIYKRTELGDKELSQRNLRFSSRARTLLLLLESDDLKQFSREAYLKIASPENYQTLLDLELIVDISPSQVMPVIDPVADQMNGADAATESTQTATTHQTASSNQTPTARVGHETPAKMVKSITSSIAGFVSEAVAAVKTSETTAEKPQAKTSVVESVTPHQPTENVVTAPETTAAPTQPITATAAVTAPQQAVQTAVVQPTEAPAAVEPVVEPESLSFPEIKHLMQNTLKQYCGLMAKNLVVAIEQCSSTHEIRQHQSKWLTSLFETRISRQQLNELLRIINHSMDKIEIAS